MGVAKKKIDITGGMDSVDYVHAVRRGEDPSAEPAGETFIDKLREVPETAAALDYEDLRVAAEVCAEHPKDAMTVSGRKVIRALDAKDAELARLRALLASHDIDPDQPTQD